MLCYTRQFYAGCMLLFLIFVFPVASLLLELQSLPRQRCTDGSPAGFYTRTQPPPRASGTSTPRRFLLYAQGGGWCNGGSDCIAVSGTSLGSSSTWPRFIDESGSGMCCCAGGILASSQFDVVALLPNCDQTSLLGAQEAPIDINGHDIYLQGRHILDAVLKALVETHNLTAADTLVFAGSSSGGMAVLLNIDHVADMARTLVPGAHVRGIMDSSWFMDIPNMYSGEYWLGELFEAGFQTWNATLDPMCLGRNQMDPVRCLWPATALPFVRTPIFVVQPLYDWWQVDRVMGVHQPRCLLHDSKGGGCGPDVADALPMLKESLLQQLSIWSPVGDVDHSGKQTAGVETGAAAGTITSACGVERPSTVPHGFGLSACLTHGQTLSVNGVSLWDKTMINGHALSTRVEQWLLSLDEGCGVDVAEACRAGVHFGLDDCEWPCNDSCLTAW